MCVLDHIYIYIWVDEGTIIYIYIIYIINIYIYFLYIYIYFIGIYIYINNVCYKLQHAKQPFCLMSLKRCAISGGHFAPQKKRDFFKAHNCVIH